MDGQNSKHYDLEERTFKFAKKVKTFGEEIPKTIINMEDGKLMKIFGSIITKST